MKNKILITSLLLMFFVGCQEKEYGPLVKSDHVPNKLSNVEVENIPGGAKITYTLPDDNDLLYVLAVYSLADGKERVVKASSYTNFVVLEGFADINQRQVQLYTVNRSENRSEPVSTTIKPLESNLYKVFGSLQVQETFGGVNAKFINEKEEEYVLYTLYREDDGRWVVYDRLYSKAKEKDYSVFGLSPNPRDFAFYFVDKWKNHSDTLQIYLTPLFEEKLDKSLWKHLPLLTDTYEPEFDSWTISNLWDEKIIAPYIFYVKGGLPGLKLPNWFTIDLGKKSMFSRIRINQLSHDNSWIFASGAPREFEVYGSNNPGIDGGWDTWTLIGKFESKKPSDKPLGELTTEDISVGKAGEDFTLPIASSAFRYIRFKTNKTWGGNANTMLAELTLWGQTVE